jgi:hypothetical protein
MLDEADLIPQRRLGDLLTGFLPYDASPAQSLLNLIPFFFQDVLKVRYLMLSV